MPLEVTMGASLMCSFGAAPATYSVLPAGRVLTKTPAGNITDFIPMTNILPFGVCTSLANPTVASATSAAMGVLTPMPCVPSIPAPWIPTVPTVLSGKAPALANDSKLMCMWGGVIQVVAPGQFTVNLG